MIIDLFVRKSEQHSNGKDILSVSAKLVWLMVMVVKKLCLLLCLYTRVKHDLALAENGLKLLMLQERLHDIIVYCVIGF